MNRYIYIYIFLPLNEKYVQLLQELTDEICLAGNKNCKTDLKFAVKLMIWNGLKIKSQNLKIPKDFCRRGTRGNNLYFFSLATIKPQLIK